MAQFVELNKMRTRFGNLYSITYLLQHNCSGALLAGTGKLRYILNSTDSCSGKGKIGLSIDLIMET